MIGNKTQELFQEDVEVKKIVNCLNTINLIIKERSSNGVRMWVPKVLVFVSEYPYYDYLKLILHDFYQYFRGSKGMNNVVEAHIFNIVFKIMVPQRNDKAVCYYLLKGQ
jgi:hypothetical protein